ncbi:MAG: tape measure protein [Caudoviricetes sp.]|nr:MAG: tape measure protein [Caudoviricetes sp.]
MSALVKIGFKAETGQLRTAETDLNRLTKAGGNLDNQILSLKNTVGLLGVAMAAVGSSQLASELIKQSDAWKGITGQLRQVTASEKDLVEQRTMLLKLSKDTRSDVDATVSLYTTLVRATKELGTSQSEVAGITRTINNLFIASGKSAEESAGAIRQLSQGLASGALRGDEFNSVAENAPRILDALSAKLGLSVGKLREFAATGGITAKILTEALSEYSATAQKMADQTDKTFGQSMVNANTNILEFVGGMDSINSLVSSLGGGIEDLSENIDSLAYGIGASASVIAVAMLPALGKMAFAQALLIKETLLLGTTQTRVISVMGSYTTVAATATVATNALAMATRFLLGPWGLLITAVGAGATAFYASKNATEDLTGQIKGLNDEVDRSINLYDSYITKTSDAAAIALKGMGQSALQEEFDKTSARIAFYETKLKSLKESHASFARTSDLETKLKLEKLQLEAISKILPNAKTSYELLSDAVKKLVDKLDPVGAATRKYDADLKLLKSSLDSGIISTSEYNTYLSALKKQLDESTKSNDDFAKSVKELIGSIDPAYAALQKFNEGQKLLDSAMKAGLVTTQRHAELTKMLGDQYQLSKVKSDTFAESLKSLEERLDPVGAASKKFKTEQAQLNKALETGAINAVRFDFLMAELEKQLNATSSSNLDDLISKASDFGGAWSQAGSDIVNAFGSAASVLDDFGSKMAGIAELQGELTKKRLEYADSSAEAKKIDLALFDLSQQAFQSNIGAVGRLAGVTAKAFKEQSKERQALHRIETAFAAIEIALAAEKAIMNATAAVANQGSGDPYTAFGRIAAMAGIMGAILGVAGIAFGGGSSGGVDVGAIQDQQGTGTVLGSDDKSESILSAIDQYNDIGIDQLAELRGIRDAMVSLSNGIAQLAVSLVTSSKFGGGDVTGLGGSQNLSGIVNFADKLGLSSILGVLGDNIIGSVLGGLFGSTKKKLVDSGIQFDSQTLGDIFSGQFEAVYYNVIETTKKKFWGLSKKTSTSTVTSAIEGTILEEFGSIFGYIGDSVTQSLDVLGITSEKALENYVLSLGSISFKDMSGEEIQKELEAIFSQQADLIAKYMLPQISKWQKMGEGSFEALTRVAKEQAVFNDALSNLGISLVDVSSIMQIDVAQAIITMMGGLDEFASATGAYFSKFFSEAEQFAAMGSSINDVFVQLGVTMPMSRESFKALVDGLDLTTEAGQQMFATLMQLVPSMDAYLSELEKQQAAAEKLLIDTAKEAYSALQKAVSAEKTRAQEAYSASQKVYQAEIERINGVRRAIEQVYETLQNNLTSAASMVEASFSAAADALTSQFSILESNAANADSALNASFNAEIERINSISSARISALDKEAAAISSSINELLGLSESMGKAAGLISTVEGALAAARTGDFSLAKSLSVTPVAEAGFTSETDMKIAQALQNNRLMEISNLAGKQATVEERMLSGIEAQKTAIESQTEATVSALKEQLNSLIGIDDGVLSIDESVKAYKEAMDALNAFDLDGQLAALESQKNSLLGINTNVLSISEAIAAYNAAQLALDEFGYEAQLDALSRQEELSMQQLDIAEKAYNDEIARLDLILADGESQLNALLGINDSVLSVADAVLGLRDAILAYEQSNAAAAIQSNSNAVAAQQAAQASKEIADEIKKMREENTAAQQSIAKSSERTSNVLTRIEQGGLETY